MSVAITCMLFRHDSGINAFISAIQCDGAALPNLTDSVTATPHSGLFPYSSTVSYACPDGQRFDDGNTDVVVTCAGVGVWNWNPVVTSCRCEFVSRPTKLCVCVGFFVGLSVGDFYRVFYLMVAQ